VSNPLDISALEDRARDLVEQARKAGADAADAVVVRSVSLSAQARLGKIEELQRSESDDLSLRVFIGKQVASVSGNDFSNAGQFVERALAMAKVAPEDPFAGLAESGDLAIGDADLDLLDSTQPASEALSERALRAEAAMLAQSGVSNSGGASAGWGLGGMVLATSNGFSGTYLGSHHSTSATAVAGEGTGMERDYEFSSVVYEADLTGPEEIGERAAKRALARLNPRKVDSTTGAVVFAPRVSRTVLGHLAGAINGSAIARQTSFLKDKLGEKIFAAGIVIRDDPTRRRGLRSRPFDGEGVRCAPLTLVEDGVLQTWLLDSGSARELGLKTNGRAMRSGSTSHPGTTNIALAPGAVSPEDMVAGIEKGLFVTDLIGHGGNLITGDYSRGAAGFWIENGKIQFPVAEVTIAGNLADIFARLVPADDFTYRYGMDAPTLMVDGLTIAGR